MTATGGGASNPSSGGVTLHTTHSIADGHGWQVRIASTTESSFTMWLVCIKGLWNVTTPTWTTYVYGGGSGFPTTDCQGAPLLGGGGWSDNLLTRVWGSYPVDYPPGWRFEATNLDSAPQNLVATSVCGYGIVDLQKKTGNYSASMPPRTMGSANVSCPGTSTLSGGIYISGAATLTDSYPVGDGTWQVYFYNSSDQYNALAAAEVVCGT